LHCRSRCARAWALGIEESGELLNHLTKKRGNSNETSPEKVRMHGRRCGVFQETDDGEKLNVGVMKEFTGGDKVLVRDLYKGANEMIEFKPQMKYFLTCNQLPDVPANDDGTWRRLRVIDFSSKFTDNPTKPNEFKINTNLKQDIQNWATTFLSYMIHIYETCYKNINYLKEPDEVMASTYRYKMENDFYTEYSTDRISYTDNLKNTISREVLYADFKGWFKTNYEGKPVPKKPEFEKNINKIIGEPTRKGYVKLLFNTIVESDNDSIPPNVLDM
jgi:phage/plasmid-associated DNA primase